MIAARIQSEPFDAAAEMAALTRGRGDVGALVSFTGLVRGAAGDSLMLEHYPGMTETALADIAAKAAARWAVSGTVIHRYGTLAVGEAIVLVAVTSSHRGDAFRACEFLIDWLKTKAPFWKREADGRWVDARGSDDRAAARWS